MTNEFDLNKIIQSEIQAKITEAQRTQETANKKMAEKLEECLFEGIEREDNHYSKITFGPISMGGIHALFAPKQNKVIVANPGVILCCGGGMRDLVDVDRGLLACIDPALYRGSELVFATEGREHIEANCRLAEKLNGIPFENLNLMLGRNDCEGPYTAGIRLLMDKYQITKVTGRKE